MYQINEKTHNQNRKEIGVEIFKRVDDPETPDLKARFLYEASYKKAAVLKLKLSLYLSSFPTIGKC